MSRRDSVILVVDQSEWRLVRGANDAIEATARQELNWSTPKETVNRIRAQLVEWKLAKQPIIVALESSLCVSAQLKLPNAKYGKQRQAMAYLFEPLLPWAAEEIVADYEIRNTDAFSVAVSVEQLQLLFEALDDEGIPVQSVTPLARLALEAELKRNPSTANRLLLIWENESSFDLWIVERKRPTLWRHVPAEPEFLRQELSQIALESADMLTVRICTETCQAADCVSQLTDFRLEECAGNHWKNREEAALSLAILIANGSKSAPIELRRDAFESKHSHESMRKYVGSLQLAFLFLLSSVAVTLYQFSNRFDQQRLRAGDQQAEVFRRLFSNTPVPVGVRTRLESERALLSGIRGVPLAASSEYFRGPDC